MQYTYKTTLVKSKKQAALMKRELLNSSSDNNIKCKVLKTLSGAYFCEYTVEATE